MKFLPTHCARVASDSGGFVGVVAVGRHFGEDSPMSNLRRLVTSGQGHVQFLHLGFGIAMNGSLKVLGSIYFHSFGSSLPSHQ